LLKKDTTKEKSKVFVQIVGNASLKKIEACVRYVLQKRIKKELLKHTQKDVKQSTKNFVLYVNQAQG